MLKLNASYSKKVPADGEYTYIDNAEPERTFILSEDICASIVGQQQNISIV